MRTCPTRSTVPLCNSLTRWPVTISTSILPAVPSIALTPCCGNTLTEGIITPFPGNFLLVENSFTQEPPELDEFLYSLKLTGYRPILAHPERYTYYWKYNPTKYGALYRSGTFMQVNLLSLAGFYGKEEKKQPSGSWIEDMSTSSAPTSTPIAMPMPSRPTSPQADLRKSHPSSTSSTTPLSDNPKIIVYNSQHDSYLTSPVKSRAVALMIVNSIKPVTRQGPGDGGFGGRATVAWGPGLLDNDDAECLLDESSDILNIGAEIERLHHCRRFIGNGIK